MPTCIKLRTQIHSRFAACRIEYIPFIVYDPICKVPCGKKKSNVITIYWLAKSERKIIQFATISATKKNLCSTQPPS